VPANRAALPSTASSG